jgi:hypothetical protein
MTMRRNLPTPTTTAVRETAWLCCRRSPAAPSRTRHPLPREADLGWERAAYLALDNAI